MSPTSFILWHGSANDSLDSPAWVAVSFCESDQSIDLKIERNDDGSYGCSYIAMRSTASGGVVDTPIPDLPPLIEQALETHRRFVTGWESWPASMRPGGRWNQ